MTDIKGANALKDDEVNSAKRVMNDRHDKMCDESSLYHVGLMVFAIEECGRDPDPRDVVDMYETFMNGRAGLLQNSSGHKKKRLSAMAGEIFQTDEYVSVSGVLPTDA